MQQDYSAVLAAPFGMLGIIVENGELTAIDFLPAGADVMAAQDAVAAAVCAALAAYLRDPAFPLDALPLGLTGTPFQQRVWQAISAIPPGHTLSYSELAWQVGSGPRAVANACGANPVPLVIPCHRVVARHGLGGFMRGRAKEALAIKQWLLGHERRRLTAA